MSVRHESPPTVGRHEPHVTHIYQLYVATQGPVDLDAKTAPVGADGHLAFLVGPAPTQSDSPGAPVDRPAGPAPVHDLDPERWPPVP
jgi:hypothetical protein